MRKEDVHRGIITQRSGRGPPEHLREAPKPFATHPFELETELADGCANWCCFSGGMCGDAVRDPDRGRGRGLLSLKRLPGS